MPESRRYKGPRLDRCGAMRRFKNKQTPLFQTGHQGRAKPFQRYPQISVVARTLLVEVAFTLTGRPSVEARSARGKLLKKTPTTMSRLKLEKESKLQLQLSRLLDRVRSTGVLPARPQRITANHCSVETVVAPTTPGQVVSILFSF